MTSLCSILYVSSAVDGFGPTEAEALAFEDRLHHFQRAVTGTLLHGDGNFMGYLEGQRASLADCFGRVRSSAWHGGVFEISTFTLEARLFPDWSFVTAQRSISKLLMDSKQRWKRRFDVRQEGVDPPALEVLFKFWSGVRL